ncbi:MAG: rhomboid family intramembrane serine protease [Bacteroidota bacterium]
MPVVLPIGSFDASPPRGVAAAPVTLVLVAACLFVFVGPQEAGRAAGWAVAFGLVPADLGAAALVTSLFAHASWGHLLYNAVALWVFGSALERRIGSARLALVFLGLGAGAMFVEALARPESAVPIVGASGGVAAVAGAFAVAFPRSRVVVAAVFLTIPVPARVALGLWAAVEVASGISAALHGPTAAADVAHLAHLTGFALGASVMAALPGFRRPSGPVDDSEESLRTAIP